MKEVSLGNKFQEPEKSSLWYKFVVTTVREVILPLIGKQTVTGVENIPKDGPVIIASVHLSNLDPPLVSVHIPRKVNFMAKKELFFFPLGGIIGSLGAFPVSRGRTDSSAFRKAADILANDQLLMLFPEGTRGDGITLGKIQKGMALLASKGDVKIVPVGISGTEKALPKNAKWFKRSPLKMNYGKPFTLSEISRTGKPKDGMKIFADELEKRLLEECQKVGLELKTASEK